MFGWHTSLYILKTKASRSTKLCTYFNFYSLYNIWPTLQNKRVAVLRMAFQARKVFCTFQKQVSGPSKWHQRRVVFSRPYVDDGKNFSSRVAAHAPTKYQSNSTSGRGARASYRTMLPEISARRSLLESSFRYLSPGREGEKCRPLDHTWQNPFVHSVR